MYTLLFSKDNTHKIVWAIGSTDGDSNGNIRKHYKKGSKSVLFLSLAGRSQTKPVPNTYLDILNSNVRALTGHYFHRLVTGCVMCLRTLKYSSLTKGSTN